MSNKAVKRLLAQRYGKVCMLCGKRLKLENSQYHHIKPKSMGGGATVLNGALLHAECHMKIHKYKFNTDEYRETIRQILNNKKRFDKWG